MNHEPDERSLPADPNQDEQSGLPSAAAVKLPVLPGRGGLVAGVDPLSNKSLLEAAGDDG